MLIGTVLVISSSYVIVVRCNCVMGARLLLLGIAVVGSVLMAAFCGEHVLRGLKLRELRRMAERGAGKQ